MELHLIKRVMQLNGRRDVSFKTWNPLDEKRSEKIPEQKAFLVETKIKRDTTANSKLWALCGYFVENLPERYYNTTESGDLIPVFKTSRELYEVLKIRVGYTDVLKVGDAIYTIPKKSNFDDQKDELEYMDQFHTPALEELSMMSDMTIYEMSEASRQWRLNK